MAGEWTSCRLADCLTAEFPGEWGTEAKCDGTGATVLRATDIDDDGHVDLLGGSVRNIAPKKIAEKRLQIGDILLEASGGGPGKPVGRVALFDPQGDGIYLSSNFFRTLRPNSKVEPRFLAYALQRLHLLPVIWRFQQQTTGIINLKVQEYLEHLVEVPNRLEQRRIAEILDTVDEAIRRTEQVIEKLQQIKQGLLHDLLTRGIDDNGELRPPPEEAPHLYKDSPVGLIPLDWSHARLQDVSEKIADRDHTTPMYVTDGILMVSPVHFFGDDDIEFVRCPRISVRDHLLNRKKTDLKTDDIVIHRIGAGLGRVRLVRPTWPEFSILHSLAMIRPFLKLIVPRYLLVALRARSTRHQIGLGIQSIGVPDLGLDKIGSLVLPLPACDEQIRLSNASMHIQTRIESERNYLAKLLSLKKGLMDDLLSGKVRVTMPEGEC